ncbi:hypothetical protein R1sor_009815 [Riccia sorocarpa]|uniref:FCP1 homology domain-containing protein n=1 Tax=Riccia sorocarpa TaxID=122646 RepID=A0ABD3HY69_9MARC
MKMANSEQKPESVYPGPCQCQSEAPENYACLPPISREDQGKKTLVLDLDETLVHSSFRPVPHYDFNIQVEVENKLCNVYVIKRPGVDQFLQAVSRLFEVVVFTASLRKYADPLLDILDPLNLIKYRRYRESCRSIDGGLVKDLSMLGRDLSKVIIIDNSPHSYILQPANAIPIGTFIDDMRDRELMDLLPDLEMLARLDCYPNYRHAGCSLASTAITKLILGEITSVRLPQYAPRSPSKLNFGQPSSSISTC